ncbi:CYTH domain-containing protein [Bacillus sp. MUM 13]|uniref:CYTH domain-containing protein n=1 Tax=Bacillus sp. MUM 13 TaxID=1678001 RepID=UPI0008F599DA|nr:CYTH domain-containing protein [Bacillus sp. MUM 13]OIK08542.1 CYTH domain-containing protein [Bacillus sp. MUM 13]
MDQHIEIEFKNLLSQEEFNKLTNYFNVKESDFVLQENHYFDTSDFALKNQKSALRIRVKQGKHELTLKQPARDGLLESNQQLTPMQAEAFLKGEGFPEGEIQQLLISVNVEPQQIEFFGTLKTSRFEFPYKNGLLVLDHSHYLGTEDFEMEYEALSRPEGQEIFSTLLETLQIPERMTENKVKRFYLQKMKKMSE